MSIDLSSKTLVRVFMRSKKDNSNDRKPGDFQRRSSDNCGISTFYLSKVNEEPDKQVIYNNFKPQKMGMFQTHTAKVKKAGFQLIESSDGSGHVSICCSDCDLNDKYCAESCKRRDDKPCPLKIEAEVYTLMNLFEPLDNAIDRKTNWTKNP